MAGKPRKTRWIRYRLDEVDYADLMEVARRDREEIAKDLERRGLRPDVKLSADEWSRSVTLQLVRSRLQKK